MTLVNVGDQVVLAVQVRDGQYHLKPLHAQIRSWPPSEHGLLVGEASWIAVLAGQDWATVEVEIDSRTGVPAGLSETWDMVTERTLITNDSPDLAISDPYTAPQHVLVTPEYSYRVRVHCRDRGLEQSERYLIQLWPDEPMAGERLLVGPDGLATDLRG